MKISHIYRKANFCVDALANIGCMSRSSLTFYEQPPTDIGQLFLADRKGAATSRRVIL